MSPAAARAGAPARAARPAAAPQQRRTARQAAVRQAKPAQRAGAATRRTARQAAVRAAKPAQGAGAGTRRTARQAAVRQGKPAQRSGAATRRTARQAAVRQGKPAQRGAAATPRRTARQSAVRQGQPARRAPRAGAHPATAEPESPPDLHLAPPPRRRDLAWVLRTGALVFLVLFVGLLATGVLKGVVTQAQGRIDQLEDQVATAIENDRLLRFQRAELLSPARLRREASGRLGMMTPTTVVYLVPSVIPSGTPAP